MIEKPGTELIIFDCDGVLLDSEIIAARAHAKAFRRAGWPVTESELVKRFTGVADSEMYRILEDERGEALPSTHDGDVKSAIRRAYVEELQPVRGVQELLRGISLPVCVASSSSSAKLALGLTQTGLYERFAPNIFSTDLVMRGKPAPDIFLYAAAKMQAQPSRCVVVEDSVAGVQAGVAAGMTVIGFCGASHCDISHGQTLAASGARAAVSSMTELAQVLREI